MRAIVMVAAALLVACGGDDSQSVSPAPSGPSGVVVDPSGVWVGDIGFGDTLIIIDADGTVLGLGHLHGQPPETLDEYRSVIGQVTEDSEQQVVLNIFTHPSGYLNTHFYPTAGRRESVHYHANLIERQTVDVRAAGGDQARLLTYQAPQETISLEQIAGRWEQISIYDAGSRWFDDNGFEYIAKNHAVADFEISGTGEIIGTETLTGWNWLMGQGLPASPCGVPCGGQVDEWHISGQISLERALDHNIYAIEISRGMTEASTRELHGYLLAVGVDILRILLIDPQSDIVAYSYELRRTP